MQAAPGGESSYRPPPIGGRTAPDHRPLQLRPIAVGVAVDWAATFATTLLIGIAATAIAVSRDPDEAAVAEYLRRLSEAPDFAILSALVGLLCVSLGGYVCAQLAKRDELRHAALVGVASLAIGLLLELGAEPTAAGWHPLWFRVLGHVLVIPAALLGGALSRAGRAPAA